MAFESWVWVRLFYSTVETGKSVQCAVLSRRERQVVRLVAFGLTNHEIGERLVISEATVKHYLAGIMLSLVDVSTRTGLARWVLSSPDALQGHAVVLCCHPDGCQCAAPFCTAMRLTEVI